ncbi:MAG TPA: coenzyme F420-0:L-glutamate ligase [Elusimicrobiales bacterium]|nr:coenzyme F420-0:L-glutamate ligase [Elusimicrobiales bacterium]
MQIKTIKTRVFKEGENLLSFVNSCVPKIKDKSILVITSKIIALAEKRTVPFKSEKEFEKLIKSQSSIAIKSKPVWFTVKDDILMPNAGIDKSNSNGKIILLPKDSFKSAQKIRNSLIKKHKIKNLGIIITDSCFMPFRSGITAISIGYAGFKAVSDHRGKKDIFGRKLHLAKTNIVDSIASFAAMLMGEANECKPLALIENAPVKFTNRINRKELSINPADDLYKPFFSSLKS